MHRFAVLALNELTRAPLAPFGCRGGAFLTVALVASRYEILDVVRTACGKRLHVIDNRAEFIE